jgi:hypothetical protein
MKSRTIVFSLILALLSSALTGVWFIDLGSANPGFYLYPHSPQTLILVQSPENNTTHNNTSMNTNFTLDLSTWVLAMDGILNPNYSAFSSVICYLDSHSVWEKTVNSAEKFNFSVPLSGLSEGLHTIEVNATTTGQHYSYEPKWGLYDTPVLGSSGVVYFVIDTIAPRLSILSLENKTYYSPYVDLNFTVNEANSQVEYSLDGKENVTLSLNTLLTGLAIGNHNLIVYAMDEVGNISSQTIYFKIAESFPTLTFAVVLIILVVLADVILIYFWKRRSETL